LQLDASEADKTTTNAPRASVWISLSSSVILFNKWILSTLKFGKRDGEMQTGRYHGAM